MKKILAILLSSLLLVSLVACSGNNDNVQKSQTVADSQSIGSSDNSQANDDESKITDEDIVGQWLPSGNSPLYTYNADGTGTVRALSDKDKNLECDFTWTLEDGYLTRTQTYLEDGYVYAPKFRVELSSQGYLVLYYINKDGKEDPSTIFVPYE